MKTKFALFVVALCMLSCGSANTTTKVAADDYGYSQKNAIKVGGGGNGPTSEREYLNRLTGPNGESITYNRRGSCCAFDTPNSSFGGMLDIYEVEVKGDSLKKILYLNMYDKEKVYAPKGFILKN